MDLTEVKFKLNDILQNYGPKSYGRILKFSYPELLKHITELTLQYSPASINEMIYIIINRPPNICDNGKYPAFNTFQLGYRTGCGRGCKCAKVSQAAKLSDWHASLTTEQKKSLVDNAKETFMTNLGVDNPMKHGKTIEKYKASNLEKYGAESPLASLIVKDKIKQIIQKKYGVDFPFQNESIRKLGKTTTVDRYGGLMTHARDGAYKKYDGMNPFQDSGVLEKRRSTMIEKYGNEHALKNSSIFNSMMEKNIKKYGVKNASQIGMNLESLALFENIDEFIKFAKGKTVQQLSEELECSSTKLYHYVNFHKIPGIVHPKSLMELDMKQWLISQDIKFKHNDYTILKPKQLDFLLTDYDIGIELHGLFHHSEVGGKKDNDYHENKFLNCKKRGVQLIQIWQDEYWKHKDVVRSKILYLCHKHTNRIHGRKCKVGKLYDTDVERAFLNKHHIQGFVDSRQFSVGAWHDDKLMAIMSFGHPHGYLELIRFAVDINFHIPGIFSKLLKHAIISNNITEEIFSFSDNRISNGNLYKQSGFELVKESAADYCYTNYIIRENKRRFQKTELIKRYDLSPEYVSNKDNTEWKIISELGFHDRLWDAGKILWKFNPNNFKLATDKE